MINWPSTIGLFLDIIGVLLLFRFGLPSKILLDPRKTISETSIEIEKRKKCNKKITIGAYLGLTFILIGFALQLIGTNLERLKQNF